MGKEKRLSINGATILDGNLLYFAINNGNGLFCYDLLNRKLTFLGCFPGEDSRQHDLFYTMIKYNNFLLFPPHCAKKFAVYNIEKQIFTEWDFLSQMRNREVGRAILYKDKAYLFGTWVNPYLLKIDLNNRDMIFNEIWMNEIHPEGRGERCHISTTGLNQNGQNLFLTVTTKMGAEMICFNMEEESIDRIALPVYPEDFEWVYATAYGIDNKVWTVIDKNGQVLEMEKNGQRYKFHNTLIEKKAKKNSFLRIFRAGHYLILVPYMANRIIKMDIDTGKANALYCEKNDEVEEYGDSLAKYSWSEYRDGKLYLFRRYALALEIVDLKYNSVEEIVFVDKKNVSTLYMDGGRCYPEGLTINNGLDVYTNGIKRQDYMTTEGIENKGKLIYNRLKEKGNEYGRVFQ